jgi:glutaredoxin 3
MSMFGKTEHKVTIYTTPSCSVCRKAKEYLAQNGITYEEIDVAADRRAADEMVQKSGQMGVPVIIADGVMLVGFNQLKLDVALKIKK